MLGRRMIVVRLVRIAAIGWQLRAEEILMLGYKRILAGALGAGLIFAAAILATDVEAQGIIRVKPSGNDANDGSSWPSAMRTLQAALFAISSYGSPADEIWVAAGTYAPTDGTDRTATFQLQSGVAIYGGFAGSETSRDARNWEANVTTLSGDIGVIGDNSDNSYHVVTANATDSTAILDGFTIADGNASIHWGFGGGIYGERLYEAGATLTVKLRAGSTVQYNSAGGTMKDVATDGVHLCRTGVLHFDWIADFVDSNFCCQNGAGISCDLAGELLSLTNCHITNNGVGILHTAASHIHTNNCSFSNNGQDIMDP